MTSASVPAAPTVASPSAALPATGRRSYPIAWWGMVVVIMTEGMVFLGLLASYFFLRAASTQWPPAGVELPELGSGWIFSVVLWGSSLPLFWAEAGIKKGSQLRLRAGLALSLLMGLVFLLYTFDDFSKLHFGWREPSYGSIFYTIVGLHAIHVGFGLVMNMGVQAKVWQGKITAERHRTLQVFSLYWHFVDAVWVAVFLSLFVSPHIR